MILRSVLILTLALSAAPKVASAELTLALPAGAKHSKQVIDKSVRNQIAAGPFSDGKIKWITTDATATTDVWKLAGQLETLSVLNELRNQAVDAGFEPIFECETRRCGGFDFRFEIDVLPEPDMRVDLRDFRYFSAKKETDDNPIYLTLLVSKTPESTYVQVTQIRSDNLPIKAIQPEVAQPDVHASPEITINPMSFVLEGLEFEMGSPRVGNDPQNSRQSLADFLVENPDVDAVLVGHSDSSGSLSANVVLSKQRAEAVRTSLIQDFDVAPNRLSAEGVGYLAPRATNATPEGRSLNRRVEAVFKTRR